MYSPLYLDEGIYILSVMDTDMDKGNWATALSNLFAIVKVAKDWGVRHYLSIYHVHVACLHL